MNENVRLRPLAEADAQAFEEGFSAIGWSKPRAQFERYFAEQTEGERWVCVAERKGVPVGYVTVVWNSKDPSFRAAEIPEVMDLNVLPHARRAGVGTQLMTAAEEAVRERGSAVGLRVGLHPGYGSAQRLYIRRGYVPDGTGALSGTAVLEEGATVTLDDDLTLRLRKALTAPPVGSYLADLRRMVGSRLLVVPSVAVIVRRTDGAVLLARSRVGGDWSLPAGAIELGESPEAAAQRELTEETGIEGLPLSLVAGLGGADFRFTYRNGDLVEYQIFVFDGSTDQAPTVSDGIELDRVQYFSREDAPQLAIPYPTSLLWRRAP